MKTTIYHDVDYQGLENPNGTIKEYTEDDALNSALSIWLTSKKGDYIRDPRRGGPLDIALFKNLTNTNIEKLKFSLNNLLSLNFENLLKVRGISIINNKELRWIEVEISYLSLLSGEPNKVKIYIDDPSQITIFKYEEIEWTGETLENFVIVKEPFMDGKLIVWSVEEDSYVWGKYKLINLTTSDPRFNSIITIANSR